MYLTKTKNQSRQDFVGEFKCGQCEHEIEASGYSDGNFFENAIPNAICPKCGKSESGETKEEQIIRLGRHYKLMEV